MLSAIGDRGYVSVIVLLLPTITLFFVASTQSMHLSNRDLPPKMTTGYILWHERGTWVAIALCEDMGPFCVCLSGEC
jgi:hypothetical protein